MASCTEPDCNRPVRGRGLCGTHYAYRRRHEALPPLTPGPSGCSVEGCDREHEARGLCAMHYQRLTKGRGGLEQPVATAPDEVRFWAKADRSGGPAVCWPWTAGINKRTGYGHFWRNRKTYLAHRVAYELAVGPIPAGLELDHVKARGCTLRHCVNPAHLEPVTSAINNGRIVVSPQISARRAAAGRKGAAARWG